MAEGPEPAAGGVATRGGRPMELFLLLGFFALWIILQAWVLPKAGVPT